MNIEFNSIAFELPLISYIIICIIAITYFAKNFGVKNPVDYEKKIFDYILVTALIYALTNTSLHVLCSLHTLEELLTEYYLIINATNKFLMGMLVTISQALFMYTCVISYNKTRKNFLEYAFVQLILFIFYVAIIAFSEVDLVYTGTSYNVEGFMPTVTYIFVGIYIAIAALINFVNFNKNDKRYFVMFYIILIAAVLVIISLIVPGIIIYDFGLAMICFIMFHTIENPDLKLIEELNVAKDDAIKANNAKSDFLSSMSHEIRTPLNAIIGLSNDLKDNKKFPQELYEDAEDIVHASNTLLEIVGNIMDISKIERNKLDIIEEEYSFREILEEILKINEYRLKDKKLDIKLTVDKNIPYKLYGDKIHIKQIVNNLISNSLKYTDNGSVIIDVKCVNENSNSLIEFTVEDTGIGIKQELLDKLFEKFERLGAEKNSTVEGTGLGLAISKELVELLGGEIIVESSYGIGSKFVVKLKQKIISLEASKEDLKNDVEEEIDYSSKKILVVDDHLLNIKVATRMLMPLKAEVDTVMSGAECLEKVKEKKYDIILMDIMMPDMNGIETLEKLKEDKGFNIPVVALTADAVVGTKEKYLKDGFDDYLAKPFSKVQIKELIVNILSK